MSGGEEAAQPVLCEVADGVATITLNRPASLNAFEATMAHSWAAAANEVTTRDDVRAIVLAGAGRAFCAGGDIAAMAQGGETGLGGDGIRQLATTINDGIRALTASAIPIVAAAHGTTAGGGLGILLTSDYAIVGESSRIGSVYAGVGLTPDLSVSEQLTRAVGERRALQLLLTDGLISAEQALEWGLVAEVVPDPEVQGRAQRLARHWADGAWHAYGQAKRLIRSRPTRTADAQLQEEARTIGAAYETADAQARIRAFVSRAARKA